MDVRGRMLRSTPPLKKEGDGTECFDGRTRWSWFTWIYAWLIGLAGASFAEVILFRSYYSSWTRLVQGESFDLSTPPSYSQQYLQKNLRFLHTPLPVAGTGAGLLLDVLRKKARTLSNQLSRRNPLHKRPIMSGLDGKAEHATFTSRTAPMFCRQ